MSSKPFTSTREPRPITMLYDFVRYILSVCVNIPTCTFSLWFNLVFCWAVWLVLCASRSTVLMTSWWTWLCSVTRRTWWKLPVTTKRKAHTWTELSLFITRLVGAVSFSTVHKKAALQHIFKLRKPCDDVIRASSECLFCLAGWLCLQSSGAGLCHWAVCCSKAHCRGSQWKLRPCSPCSLLRILHQSFPVREGSGVTGRS